MASQLRVAKTGLRNAVAIWSKAAHDPWHEPRADEVENTSIVLLEGVIVPGLGWAWGISWLEVSRGATNRCVHRGNASLLR